MARLAFRPEAERQLNSVDDLLLPVKLPTPRRWIAVVAAVALVGGLLCWLALGRRTTTITTSGVVRGGQVVSCMDAQEASLLDGTATAGVSVTVDGQAGSVSAVGAEWLSPAEVERELGVSYARQQMDLGDWGRLVTIDLPAGASDQDEHALVPVTITVSEPLVRMSSLQVSLGI